MEQDNLAAAILKCFGLQEDLRQSNPYEHLTNEETINLADWLQRESSINAWRSIQLAEAAGDVEPTIPPDGLSPARHLK